MPDSEPELLRRIEELMTRSWRHQRHLTRISYEVKALREKIARSKDIHHPDGGLRKEEGR